VQEIKRRIAELRAAIDKEPYVFERRFLLRVLSMGHSQFAEFIGARGPNTQINSACASTTQAVGLAEDWIHAGRCSRVIVISADDVTSDHLIDWMGAGFLASGAAATDEVVADAAIPFDRRRHGMIIGMGAAALVVESAAAARERGIQPICEVLSTMTGNSAFHGTRLDVQHIGQVMESWWPKPKRAAAFRVNRSRRRQFSFPMKPIRRRAAAVPPPRSTRCAVFSATSRIAS
jgi:3-oxoacyl-(acyl-carrier-protein) synthase